MSSEHGTSSPPTIPSDPMTIQYHHLHTNRRRKPLVKSNKQFIPESPPEHCTFHLGMSEDQNSKWRRKNEDTCSFAYDFDNVKNQGFFAVFDGHGGRGAADWAAEHFQQILRNNLKKYGGSINANKISMKNYHEIDKNDKNDQKDNHKDNESNLFTNENNENFKEGNKDLIEEEKRNNFKIAINKRKNDNFYKDNSWPIPDILDLAFQEIDSQLTADNDIFAGCTAVVALLRTEPLLESTSFIDSPLLSCFPTDNQKKKEESELTEQDDDEEEKEQRSLQSLELKGREKRVLYVANVGDSRAVLCRNGKAIRLSYDHRASDPLEQQRIRDSGGFVVNDRVSGMLAVTRSLGDAEMKEYVVGRPYCSETIIDDEKDDFLIMACDGLWDVCTDQEACDLVKDISNDPQIAAKNLVKYALERESTDNLTVMFIKFIKNKN